MLDNLIEKGSAYAARMNERERRLALIVLAIAPLFLFLLVGRAAYGYVEHLDQRISALQAQILKFNANIARSQEVEERYAKIAAQHSSEWSEAEILDGLRAELYRLAQKLPPELGPDGKPVRTLNTSFGELVGEPELGPGALREGGEGYKEFALSISVPRDDFKDIVDYIERLQSSPQMLRIDRMILSRIHTRPEASLDLDITRTVVTGTIEAPADAPETREIDAPPLTWSLEDWKAEDCVTALSAKRISTGRQTLEALSEAPEATLFLEQPLEGGVYDMVVDIQADGPCRLGIRMAGEEDAFRGERMLPANGETYRYHVQFTVPEGGGPVQIPLITFETAGSKAFVENVIIAPSEV